MPRLLGRNRTARTGVLLRRDGLAVLRPGQALAEVPLDGDKVGEVISRLLQEGRLEGPLALGIDPDLDFFVCRRGQASQAEQDQYIEYLAKQVAGGLHVASCRAGRGFHVILAWPKSLVEEVRSALQALPASARPLIPTSHALLQYAVRRSPTPRRWNCHIRVLAGPRQGMALLVQRDALLARRVFNLHDPPSCAQVTAGLMGLLAHARDELGLKKIDGVLYHIGPEQEEHAAACAEPTGLAFRVAEELPYGPELLARALAAAAWKGPARPPLEVFRSTGQEETGLPRLPWRSALPAAAAAVASALWLAGAWQEARAEQTRLQQKQEELLARCGIEEMEIGDLLDALRLEVGIAHAFLARGARWHPLIAEVARILPDTARQDSLIGRYPLLLGAEDDGEEGPTYSDGERFFHLSCRVPAGNDSVPPEVDAITRSLQQSELIQAAFPRVRGAGVQLIEEDAESYAVISIDCEPRGG
ncbi:MAG: hypothetical protein D6702_01795 [Planctomycetota bacterium]|nr:MAG: hypothetical protein D6702_01795 [Planctomycetota bacterium]